MIIRGQWTWGVLLMVGWLVYANSMEGVFVYDDLPSIVENDDLRRVFDRSQWGTWSSVPHSSIDGRPLVRLTLALNYTFGGLHVWGYHAVNIAIHLLCGLLYMALLRLLLGDIWLAFVCALLWLVHPLHSECVNYIVVRTETVMGLCYLATLYCALRQGWGWALAAICCCVAGMSAKESMVTAPLAALILDRALAQKTCLEVIRRRWAFYAGLCVSWSVLAALLWHGPRGDSAGLEHVGVWDYLLNQCWVLADYGYKVFWPYPLALDYGYARPLSLLVVAPEALVLLVVGALTLWGLWRNRLAGTAMALVFLTLAPTSSLLPIATEVGAERRMYLALAALLPLLVTGLLFLLQRVLGAVQVRWVGMALASIAVLVFAGITARRNLDYRSEKTLWQSAVQAVPDNARAHNNLALALQAEGNLEQAVLSYRRALESDPNLSQAYNNLGGSLYRLRRLPEAIAVLRQALVGRPHFLEARYNLGQALLAAGQYEQAVVHLRKVLVVEPDMFAARFKAGEALLGLGRVDEALANFVRAAQLRPGDVETRLYLGRAYEQLGRASAAAGTYRRVLELQPSNAVALERITAIGAAVE